MSCRQATETQRTQRRSEFTLRLRDSVAIPSSLRNGRDLPRIQRLQKSSCPLDIELRIARFHAEDKPVTTRQREPRHVENRVIWHRQAVQRERPEHDGERRQEERACEGRWNERRP